MQELGLFDTMMFDECVFDLPDPGCEELLVNLFGTAEFPSWSIPSDAWAGKVHIA